ncbi:MAG: hypothetical protein V8T17_11110 [Oscillospiraceae bacterium]
MGCGEKRLWDCVGRPDRICDANTITIAHTVVQVNIDGKSTVVAKDRAKNKKSYRTLPLVPEYRNLLLKMKKHQEK